MRQTHFRTVASPARTDGVGDALRAAFEPREPNSQDFDAMLRRLDDAERRH